MPKSFHVGYVMCTYGWIKTYITSLHGVCLSIRIGLSLKSIIGILPYLKCSMNTKVSVNTANHRFICTFQRLISYNFYFKTKSTHPRLLIIQTLSRLCKLYQFFKLRLYKRHNITYIAVCLRLVKYSYISGHHRF